MLDESILRDIRLYALQNAAKFKGKASGGAVMGKILAKHPELKSQAGDIGRAMGAILKEVNAMSAADQLAELKDSAPELLEKKKKEERRGLPDLPGAEQGKVVTRIPPEPSKYAHVGHALSFLINYLYAEKYGGKCILKFEDTNPEKCTQEYVDSMEEDITKYLGIEPSEILLVSDEMDRMYEMAEKLLAEGHLYICTCSREDMSSKRREGIVCDHRRTPADENLALWKGMLVGDYEPGSAVVRLVGEMEAKNTVMRDPVLFRISDAEHFKHGTKYKVWPLYDFENSVGDSLHGVTHILRSSEFGTMRNELQGKIKQLLGYPQQEIVHYGRFNIRGSLTKGREIREAIESGEMIGWDDPRLVTLKALKRRGILPQTYINLIDEVGMSPSQTNIDFTVLAAINRKLLDESANRYFFVPDPQEVSISGAPDLDVRLKLHPEDEKRGFREHKTGERFLLDPKDLDGLEEGKIYRLMDCFNFRKEGSQLVFDSEDLDVYRERGERIMHWLPADADLVDVEIMMPDASVVKGKGEKLMRTIEVDEVVQAERIGFIRLDAVTDTGVLQFRFTHK